MSEQIAERKARLINEQGLHMRPADMFVRLANSFAAEVKLGTDQQLVDGKSILSLLTLAAEHGTELTIIANGTDANAAVTALAELIRNGFSEDVQDGGTQLAGEH